MYLQMAKCARKNAMSYLLTGEVTGKNVADNVKVVEKDQDNNFKKRVVTPTFYVAKWKWQAYSTCD